MTEKKKLLELENRISELMNWMHMEGKEPENREILSSLSLDSYSKVQKEKCVDDFISFVKDYRDLTIGTITRINDSIKENEKVQMKYQKIIDECNTKKTTFSEIPDYVALKDEINKEFKKRGILSEARFACEYVIGLTDEASDYEKILEYAKYLKEREELGTTDGQMTFESMTMYSNDRGEELEKEIKRIISKIVSSNDKEQIERFADYRNYMNYEILVSNDDVLNKAKLSKQSGYNSGAEVQIPYMLILLSALLMIYNDKTNSTRLVFIDEPFAKMDPTNVRTMLKFMKSQKLQMIFCAPDKTELIGNECQVILPVLRTKPDLMEIGIVEIHEGVSV